jgi:hypothetical protein
MKTTQHTTKPKRVTNSEHRRALDIDLILSLGEYRERPISKEYVMTVAKDLILMIYENKKMVTLLPWIEKNGLSRASITRWKNQYPDFNAAYSEAKYRIGQRILGNSLYKENDGSMARFCLAMYDDEFKELEEWRSNLNDKSNSSRDEYVRIVHMPTFVESGKVPPKIKEVNE